MALGYAFETNLVNKSRNKFGKKETYIFNLFKEFDFTRKFYYFPMLWEIFYFTYNNFMNSKRYIQIFACLNDVI